MGTSVEIAFGLFDTTAQQDSTLRFSAPVQSFSRLEDLKAGAETVLPAVATLEEDYFLLDGSFQPFPNQPAEQGWGLWSRQMSGENGTFDVPLQLIASFSSVHSSIGLTLDFDKYTGDCPSRIRARWYDAQGNLLATGEFTGEGSRWILEKKVEGYTKVTLEFFGTQRPYRYLKISGLAYGADYHLSSENLLEAYVTEEVDPISARLPVGMLEFSIHSDQQKFSLLNPQGIFSLLQQRQKLDVTGNIDGTPVPMGSFYLQSWTDDGDGALRITAQDTIGLLEESTFLGGIYQDKSGRELLVDILDSAGVIYEIDPNLPDCSLSGWLPVCSHREALRQVAFAMGILVCSSRMGGIRLENIPQRPAVLISSSRKLMGQQTTLREQVTGIDLTAYFYRAGQEVKELFRDWLEPGKHRLMLDKPVGGLAVSGGKLGEYGANFADLQVDTAGEVVLTGWEYAVSKRVVSYRADALPSDGRERILKIEDSTLLVKDKPQEAVQRVFMYYANRMQSNFTMLMGAEEIAWMVMVQNKGDYQLRGQLERMVIDLGRGFLTNVQIHGSPMQTKWQYYLTEAYTGQDMGVV